MSPEGATRASVAKGWPSDPEQQQPSRQAPSSHSPVHTPWHFFSMPGPSPVCPRLELARRFPAQGASPRLTPPFGCARTAPADPLPRGWSPIERER
jgi:hypothetical protein